MRALDLGLALRSPRLLDHGPALGLLAGASRRSFAQDGEIRAAGWAPTVGLALAEPLHLGRGLWLEPTLAGSRDLRRIAYRLPGDAVVDHPAWELSAGLSLAWAPGG